MFLRSRTARLAVAGVSVLALGASAAPALAESGAKPTTPGASINESQPPPVNITQSTETRKSPGKRKYVYDNTTIYWSVTAVAGKKKAKPDISLYADQANNDLRAQSNNSGKKIDFVVVDSNHAPVQSWYPTVKSKGKGKFTVQNDTDVEGFVCPGTYAGTIEAGGIVDAVDVLMFSGADYTLSVDGFDSYLMTSNADDESSWFQGAPSSPNLPGTFTGDDDWHGLIVTDASGNGGDYTLVCE